MEEDGLSIPPLWPLCDAFQSSVFLALKPPCHPNQFPGMIFLSFTLTIRLNSSTEL
jgi:hypothetical protein